MGFEKNNWYFTLRGLNKRTIVPALIKAPRQQGRTVIPGLTGGEPVRLIKHFSMGSGILLDAIAIVKMQRNNVHDD
ncbi:MAG: hypothetical protein A2X80_14450 [Geobacteraceae bacterium GWB2_52_12]|nr:MAG: hypothetical protein A2X80_14450 [Geobacteraceae bacterium GWB2_52_12]